MTLPQTSTTIEPMAVERVIVPFQKDYFLYWGAVSSATCKHRIMWLTCRTPLGISSTQVGGGAGPGRASLGSGRLSSFPTFHVF